MKSSNIERRKIIEKREKLKELAKKIEESHQDLHLKSGSNKIIFFSIKYILEKKAHLNFFKPYAHIFFF